MTIKELEREYKSQMIALAIAIAVVLLICAFKPTRDWFFKAIECPPEELCDSDPRR